jgi:Ca-activated chloride channel family protein
LKSKHSSFVTVFVGLVVILGLLTWIAVPSLLRARVAGPPRHDSYAPLTLPAYPQSTVPAPAKELRREAHGFDGPRVVGTPPVAEPEMNTEAYDRITDNAFLSALTSPLSTFSVDVDTASYANVRRFLDRNQLPPKDAVRIEELVNYFRFAYPDPQGDEPFAVSSEVAACPWNARHRLIQIGLQARRLPPGETPPRNLVFLLDVLGSMATPEKLPLVKSAMDLLVEQLTENDRVSIVVYAGAAGLVLPPTSGDKKAQIKDAIDRLEAGGSTAGGAGIQLAYATASQAFIDGGVNRVILATDGDFNVGITSRGDLDRLIEEKRESGVFLSVLGFGMGNYKDSTMEALAAKGDGNYAYIDSLGEARKVLVEESGGTLVTVAKDVKIQVEFNPHTVAAYRLVGYENRVLRDTDFNDDRKDAGDVGAGHSVTALYEVVPAGQDVALPGVDPLKYQEARRPAAAAGSGELLTLKLRYKQPEGGASRLLTTLVKDEGREPSANLRFAAAVASFGMLLRDSEHKGTATWAQAAALARGAAGDDPDGHRAEFLGLVERAQRLSGPRIAGAAR